MGATYLGCFDPGSPEWHAARSNGIGGSEISAVLGLSPFESRFSLWHRKAGAIGPVELDDVMEWGHRLEGAVLGKWADNHDDDLDVHPGTFARDGWMIANPDALVIDYERSDRPGEPLLTRRTIEVVEAKTSPFGDGYTDDAVPPHVRCQVLWYLGVLGLPVGHVAVLIGGHDYREYRIEFDAAEFELLAQAGAEFMASLEAGHRPDIDEHSATYEAIRELHPDIDGSEHELSNAVARRFLISRTQKATADRLWTEARSMVADEMGDAAKATWDGQTIARRQARGDGTPYVVAARNLPDLHPNPDALTHQENPAA